MKLKSIKVALLASIFLLQGCWLDSDDDDPLIPAALIGVFLDSPVANMDYTTKNSAGDITRENLKTNDKGEYEYTAGETVIFSIGALKFPEVKAAGTVTPLDIADTTDPNDPEAVNMIRLLQTLDQDGDPSNGITITETAKANATQVDFSESASEFETSVSTLIAGGGQDVAVTELVSTAEAIAHFQGTLAESGVTFASINGSWLLSAGGVTFHFLPDGRYFALQWEEENGFEGFEYGTYVASDGKITFTTRENQDGDTLTCWEPRGVNCTAESNNQGVWDYSLTEDKLTVTPPGESTDFPFDRIVKTSTSPEFYGLWESKDAKEIVHFANGMFFYIDYLSEGYSGDAIFDVGTYEVTGNTDGIYSEVKLEVSRDYNADGLNCEKTATVTCGDVGNFHFDVVNQQLVAIDPAGGSDGETGRGYFDQLLGDESAPANTAKLVAQKHYDADVIARDEYSLGMNDEYRTVLETPYIDPSVSTVGNSVSVKLNIDESTSLVRESDGDANLQTRLYMNYRVPNVNSGVSVSLRLRNFGGAPSGRYVIGRCLDDNCDNEVYLTGDMTDFAGSFAGDHTMSITWDDATEEFVFTIDEKTARMKISDYTQDAGVIAAGGHDFDTNQYLGSSIRVQVKDVENAGESAFIKVHVDEVKFNGEVYDDFTGGLIDDQKWVYRASEQ